MEPTTFGLTLKQVGRLLRIGSDTKGPAGKHGDVQATRSLLDQWLGQHMPDEVMDLLSDHRHRLAGRSTKDLLLSPDTEVEVLDRLKALYKERNALAKTQVEHDVATALYYAAIAAGLVFHGRRLSSYSFQELSKAFALLSKKAWIDVELRELFAKARQVCKVDERP